VDGGVKWAWEPNATTAHAFCKDSNLIFFMCFSEPVATGQVDP